MPPPQYPKAICTLTSLGAFVTLAAMFAIPSGYSYGAVLLLTASLWFLAQRSGGWNLSRDDKLMAWVLLAYFAIPSLMTALLGNNPTDYDQYSRSLLAIPLLFLLLRVPVSLKTLWGGITLGIVLAAPLAWWQVEVQHLPRASGFLNVIHFSNFCLVFTVFCASGFYWAAQQHRHANRWRAAFALGIVGGIYSVIMGGSRGSWVALPPVAAVFLIAFSSRRNAWRILLAGLACAVVIAGLFTLPGSPLKTRYDQGAHDIAQYERDNPDTSIGARFEMWQGARDNLRVRPLLGWNTKDYAQSLAKLVDERRLAPIALEFSNNLHNNYLQAWVFTGLPGLLALLALYGLPLWHFAKRLRAADITTRVLAFCGASNVVAYLCFCLTQVVLRRNNGIMFYLLVTLILWGAMHHASLAAAETRHEARR